MAFCYGLGIMDQSQGTHLFFTYCTLQITVINFFRLRELDSALLSLLYTDGLKGHELDQPSTPDN
jgi:hypothetical protein